MFEIVDSEKSVTSSDCSLEFKVHISVTSKTGIFFIHIQFVNSFYNIYDNCIVPVILIKYKIFLIIKIFFYFFNKELKIIDIQI